MMVGLEEKNLFEFSFTRALQIWNSKEFKFFFLQILINNKVL
jgi:hypothetical protein